MALDIYFRDDIERVVEALRMTRRVSVEIYPPSLDSYEDALNAVLVAFGIDETVSIDGDYPAAQCLDSRFPFL